MTMVGRPSGSDARAGHTGTLAEVPARADGVELIGEIKGSGYRQAPSLARRSDGQTIQLTSLAHLVLEAVDGRRTFPEIAEVVSRGFGRTVSVDNVRTLVEEQLRPAGLLVGADGDQPELTRSNPLLALRFKYAVTDPDRTRRLTAPFTPLFNPVVVVLVLLALAVTTWWVLFRKGLASATHEAFANPGLLLLVVAVTVLSAGFHEFGHAAAARRAGATPGAMGAGIYLVWPAFYTDVTDSYRLGRGGRVLTDLGGLYFNALVAVGITGVWWATQYDALLLVVATQLLQMVRQLAPLVRFDGYHLLADLVGVPDLYQRIKPTLLGILPWRWRLPETTVLKPWARAVITLWVLVVVPLLAFVFYLMVITLPRLLGTAWSSAGAQSDALGSAWGDGDLVEVAARAIGVVAVLFPVLAVGIILARVVRRIATGTWRATAERPLRRALACLVGLALVAVLLAAWWPREGAYRPIQSYEGGTLTQAAAAVVPDQPRAGLAVGDEGVAHTAWAAGEPLPTRAQPQLALVLVPKDGSGQGGVPANPWVFPFDRPLAPEPGDNQALAANSTDGSVTYDVAFALIWVEDDSPALNVNEAYAFASCTDCAAVAIGFQVVLVTGDNHVAVPQNVSVAVNYDCVNCLTYALAVQLFVTLDGPLDAEQQTRLTELWEQIAAYGADIASVSLDGIEEQLAEYEEQILAIVAPDRAGPEDPTDTPTSGPAEGPSGSSTPEPTPAAPVTGTPDPAPSATPDPTSTPTAAPPASQAPSGSPTELVQTGPSPTP